MLTDVLVTIYNRYDLDGELYFINYDNASMHVMECWYVIDEAMN